MPWVDSFGPYTADLDNGGTTGFTVRNLILSGLLSNTGKQIVRVTFQAATAEAFTISKAYIGTQGAGDAYDFAATPVQLLFSASAGFALSAGQSIVSDYAAFTIPASTNIVVSFYVSGDATHDGNAAKSGLATGNRAYLISGDDAATVNTTGYSTSTDGVLHLLRIEANESGGFFF